MICSANEWTGFYMIGTSVMKELMRTKLETENVKRKNRNILFYLTVFPLTSAPSAH